MRSDRLAEPQWTLTNEPRPSASRTCSIGSLAGAYQQLLQLESVSLQYVKSSMIACKEREPPPSEGSRAHYAHAKRPSRSAGLDIKPSTLATCRRETLSNAMPEQAKGLSTCPASYFVATKSLLQTYDKALEV